ncbi:MAG: hypothetical protein HY040_11880 [Planctomycetes bacterium]|nr:hypothetical protein [Planctomycetota bacterium]
MAFFLYIFLPLSWALFGKALGWAIAAACFYSAGAKRLGRRVGNCCALAFPGIFLVLLISGGEGNAGRGFTLFGDAALLEVLCAIPLNCVVGLLVFAGIVYVIRDLTIGHSAVSVEAKK